MHAYFTLFLFNQWQTDPYAASKLFSVQYQEVHCLLVQNTFYLYDLSIDRSIDFHIFSTLLQFLRYDIFHHSLYIMHLCSSLILSSIHPFLSRFLYCLIYIPFFLPDPLLQQLFVTATCKSFISLNIFTGKYLKTLPIFSYHIIYDSVSSSFQFLVYLTHRFWLTVHHLNSIPAFLTFQFSVTFYRVFLNITSFFCCQWSTHNSSI